MKWLHLIAGLAWLFAAFEANATCTSFSVSSLNLGTYTGAKSTSGAGPGSANCTNGQFYNIGFDNGTGTGAIETLRKMTSGASTLTYQLFQDSADSKIWGNSGGPNTETGYGVGFATSFTVYPVILGNQAVPPGTYTDTVAATLFQNGALVRTASFVVTATIMASCTISASTLAFETYSGVQNDATATLTISCSNTTPYNVGLSAGNGNAATVTTRKMQGSDPNGLKYALFRDAGRTQNWGNTVGTDTVAGTGSGTAQSLSVNGRIAAGQLIAPGNYSDTIIATITY